MVRTNRAKAKLLAGEIAVGGSVNFYAPILVELYGVLGFDWVWIDCEHGSSNDSESENMIRAAELHDITPVVRVPNAEPSTLLRFLDRGAQGLIVPHINNRAEAEAVAQASHYYPMGDRSSATGGRTNRLGSGLAAGGILRGRQPRDAGNLHGGNAGGRGERPRDRQRGRRGRHSGGKQRSDPGHGDAGARPMWTPLSTQVIDGTLAEGKIIGVAGAGMTVDNVARFQQFAERGVHLMSVNVQDFHTAERGPFPCSRPAGLTTPLMNGPGRPRPARRIARAVLER